jgi:hypothetical protein
MLIFLIIPAVAGANFKACLAEVQSGKFGTVGGTDNRGNPLANISEATAITYDLCVVACGSGPEPFEWSVFSQEFSSWLLPWLALISQLPFGANDKLDNLVSMLLTVGSPVLAAYSLALTALNGRWIARLFAPHTYPNARNAMRILSSLQQSPLVVTTEGSLLTSLVILHVNDDWWNELVIWLDYTHTWSISAVTSISWVVIAYLFTLVDSFTGDITTSINANGQGVGSLWLWLLPIITGWLQISPKCDSNRLHQAVKRANKIAYVATPYGEPVLASSVSRHHAISLAVESLDNPVRWDEICTAPIYNYARFFSWVQAVEEISNVFQSASDRAHNHHSVNPDVTWGKTARSTWPSAVNRLGTRGQVEAHCVALGESSFPRRSRWGRDVWTRILLASVLALSLQWGTTGAAIVVVWFTPTAGKLLSNKPHSDRKAERIPLGLGCRSGAYIIYGAVSTIVWMMLVLSSILAHYSLTTLSFTFLGRAAALASIFLRRCGKILATFNAIWIVVSCLFQFSNLFDRCFCNSSVFGWGSARAYDVMELIRDDISHMRGAWIGGVVLAGGSAALFLIFINLLINPPSTQEP